MTDTEKYIENELSEIGDCFTISERSDADGKGSYTWSVIDCDKSELSKRIEKIISDTKKACKEEVKKRVNVLRNRGTEYSYSLAYGLDLAQVEIDKADVKG